MELKQSDTINRYDKEMKSQEELKHFQESAALFYKDVQKLYKEDVDKSTNVSYVTHLR